MRISLIKKPKIFNKVGKDTQDKFLELCKFKYRNFCQNLKYQYEGFWNLYNYFNSKDKNS